MGNREPGVDTSGFVAAADGRWVAVIGSHEIDQTVQTVAGRPWPDIVTAVRAMARSSAAIVGPRRDAVVRFFMCARRGS